MKPTAVSPVLRIASLVTAAACVLALGFAGCSRREIPSEAPLPVLRAWVPASGRSMLPTYPERCLLEIEIGVPFDALRAGDPVIYWDYTRGPAALTHHRLAQRQGDSWIAQGDNPETNPTADRAWVTRANYIARGTGRWSLVLTAPAAP